MEVVSEEDESVLAKGADCQSVECGIPVESRRGGRWIALQKSRRTDANLRQTLL